MKHKLLIATILIAAQVHAQKKVTYFPNGNKSFEGEYKLAYNTTETRDYYTFDTATDKRRTNSIFMSFRTMERETSPQKIYNGKCTFYYDNGKTSYSGTYADGVKNGMFTYWYFDGAKEAEYNYVNGMADGRWKAWHKNGKTRLEQQYTALSEAEMDTLFNKKLAGIQPMRMIPGGQNRTSLRTFTIDSLSRQPENSFRKFMEMESSFFKNAIWNGDFISYYDNGNKCTEMYYKNNTRTGTWYYRDETGKVNVSITFTDEKISGIVNNMPADAGRDAVKLEGRQLPIPGMSPAQQQHLDSVRAGLLARPTSPNPNKPDQQPKASVDVNKYMKENLVLPESAKQNKTAGSVLLRFNVNEDGTTSDFEVIRGLGNGCDEEAIRAVKSMPAWQPGKKDGKAVKSPYTLPVTFRPDPAKK
jgi:TonB family protein